jgi:hypothetical protein
LLLEQVAIISPSSDDLHPERLGATDRAAPWSQMAEADHLTRASLFGVSPLSAGVSLGLAPGLAQRFARGRRSSKRGNPAVQFADAI